MSLQDDGRRVVSSLRSRLGFRSRKQDDDYDDYDDGYDDYGDDYADGYDDGYDDGYGDDYDDYSDDAYDNAYDDPNSAYDDYAPAASRAPRSRMTNAGPRLVSFKDVRENINVSNDVYYGDEPSHYDPQANDDLATSSNPFERRMVDSSLPPQMTPEGTAEVARRASNGLDSLFTSTGEPDDYAAYDASAAAYNDQQAAPAQHAAPAYQETSARHAAPAQNNAEADFAGSFFDARSSFDTFAPQRTLCVLKLVSYREVEKVVNALKNDEVVILQLRNAPERVFPRILDFSFGAACALGAAVDCIGEKTFAISCSGALTDAERMELHEQGVV